MKKIIELQTDFYRKKGTLSLSYRKTILRNLRDHIDLFEQEIYAALKKDLNKSEKEAFLTEVQVIQSELKSHLKRLSKWSKPKRVRASILNFYSKDRLIAEPYGKVLIISPWNYPFQLCLVPLISAIAAGNTVVLKPSELAPNCSAVLHKIIEKAIPTEYATVFEGGKETSIKLLSYRWDKIFFTGSPRIGKIVHQAAAKNLTPVTLELGGKNPTIIHESAHINIAAKRIIWAKFINAGQTCIAPDYLLVPEHLKDKIVKALKNEIIKQYSHTPEKVSDYGRIINDQHFKRLTQLIEGKNVIYGGTYDSSQRYIAPTLLDTPSLDSDVMSDEIFGPILPIFTYTNMEEVEKTIYRYEKPLAAYLFTRNKKSKQWFINSFSFGGGAINDAMVQFINDRLPFGGIGNSGMGAYHGKHGFDNFTHYKAMVYRSNWPDISLKSPPYRFSLSTIKRLFKWI